MIERRELLIAGEWMPSARDGVIEVENPATEDVFATIPRGAAGNVACDEMASGIVQALEILGDEATKPLVVRLDGNNVREGRRILTEANHPLVIFVDSVDAAADKAAELAAAAD